MSTSNNEFVTETIDTTKSAVSHPAKLEEQPLSEPSIGTESDNSSAITDLPLADAPLDSDFQNSLEQPIATQLPDSMSGDSVISFQERLQSLQPLLDAGGPIVVLLGALSVISLSIVLMKLWQFFILRPEVKAPLQQSLKLWKQGEITQAQSVLDQSLPVQALLHRAMQGVIDQEPTDRLHDELSRQANCIINQLRSYLRPLEIVASLSPLLGLMGTVIGMILAFQQMEAAGSNVDPSILSGGIWQALLTTAAGLAVAIPVAAIHSGLDRKAERVSHLINDSVTQVFTFTPKFNPVDRSAEKAQIHAA